MSDENRTITFEVKVIMKNYPPELMKGMEAETMAALRKSVRPFTEGSQIANMTAIKK